MAPPGGHWWYEATCPLPLGEGRAFARWVRKDLKRGWGEGQGSGQALGTELWGPQAVGLLGRSSVPGGWSVQGRLQTTGQEFGADPVGS